jgi:hypothetical protein
MTVDGNNFISHHLKNNIPMAAGKIGCNELQILYYSIVNNNPWGQQFIKEVESGAGLYPMNEDTARWFTETLLRDIKDIDLIPRWNSAIPDFENHVFEKYCPAAHVTKLRHLEPYFFDKPWTQYLKGKRVAVFSPFAESIKKNFNNLDKIWKGKIQPNFDLISIQYPTSIPITKDTPYNTSHEVYDEFLQKINEEEFDVGIFGTGHTGLLFTLECKKLGKTGIHLGGPTQILFGIKGKRWQGREDFKPFFNDYWTSPLKSETPENRDLVEGACYW